MKASLYQKLLQDLCQVVSEGVHVVSAEGQTIVYNDAMAAIEDLRREEIIGKPFTETYPKIPADESTFLQAIKYRLPSHNRQQTYQNKHGKEISTVNSTVPVFDYDGNLIAVVEIAKDITDIKTLSNTILEMQNGTNLPYIPKDNKIKKYLFSDIVGRSRNFLEVLQKAQKASQSSASVLICGETGTGKELFAQSIHFQSSRKGNPFLAQNCAALPESLLEGLLFGTAKGGFTGAVDRQGLFEQADGGTLLLDEISAMPYAIQSKLLRVLQENYVRRIGGTKDIPVDVRVIATLNECPDTLIESGRLRKDLYYRLKVIELLIPPLRERPDDILVLAESFMDKYNEKYDKQIWMLSDEAKKKLLAHDFPGNVRELENIIMSAIALSGVEHVLSENALDVPEKPGAAEELKGPAEGAALDEYLEAVEKKIIINTLAENGGNISKTAQRLGIQRQALQYKLRKYK